MSASSSAGRERGLQRPNHPCLPEGTARKHGGVTCSYSLLLSASIKFSDLGQVKFSKYYIVLADLRM